MTSSKSYSRCPMYCRDEMSNAPSRWDIQCTVETRCSTHRCDQLDKCNKEIGKTQSARIIRYHHGRTIRPMQPNDPTQEKHRRTMSNSILQRVCFSVLENILQGQIIRTNCVLQNSSNSAFLWVLSSCFALLGLFTSSLGSVNVHLTNSLVPFDYVITQSPKSQTMA